MGDFRGDLLRHLRIDRGGVDAHVLDAELVGNRAKHVVFAHGAGREKHVQRRLVARTHGGRGGLELFGRHVSRFTQELQHIFVI